ncbi:4'-phosphopantetheinyl transferase superfamily protein [Lysobacter pythonis]|uniref:4'-phosphopantetheinyl transferase superfamily protein n=1 Tax=Solilutibacter pythonis TaxID=2483112 RepID=A0A3M2I171_9GAMM|nr:4'-phosphopantetheinyl transferase superfamily protein [Lysobacter pythonis]RMH92932.1 4'-phosphopantetheinyl transferase superfamily protein [Lysobacter pythonis]
MDRDEAAAIARLLHARDRDRSLRAHSLKRRILGSYCGHARPEQLAFRHQSSGKPYLAEPCAPEAPLQFNISHSEDAFAMAVAMCPVGVDIQWRDSSVDFAALASIVFHPAEIELWHREGATTKGFYRLWTAKEAVLKGEGAGFLREPRDVDVSVWVGDRGHAKIAGDAWTVISRQVGEYSLCVAVPSGASPNLLWYTLDEPGNAPGALQ